MFSSRIVITLSDGPSWYMIVINSWCASHVNDRWAFGCFSCDVLRGVGLDEFPFECLIVCSKENNGEIDKASV